MRTKEIIKQDYWQLIFITVIWFFTNKFLVNYSLGKAIGQAALMLAVYIATTIIVKKWLAKKSC